MTPRQRRAALQELLARHGTTRERAAELARVTHWTVDSWLKPIDNAAHRDVPEGLLELLYLKHGEPSPFPETSKAPATAK